MDYALNLFNELISHPDLDEETIHQYSVAYPIFLSPKIWMKFDAYMDSLPTEQQKAARSLIVGSKYIYNDIIEID